MKKGEGKKRRQCSNLFPHPFFSSLVVPSHLIGNRGISVEYPGGDLAAMGNDIGDCFDETLMQIDNSVIDGLENSVM